MGELSRDAQSVAVMAALAVMPSEPLQQALSGKHEVAEQRLAQLGIAVDTAKVADVVGCLESVTNAQARSAEELWCVLVNRSPSEREKRSLIPVVRLAAELAIPPHLDTWLAADLVARYRGGLAAIVRYVAEMVWEFNPADAESSLLIHCFLGTHAPDIGVPRWCDVLFEHALCTPIDSKDRASERSSH